MTQVTFKSISIEGFKSYSLPTTFQFENTGLHLIKGLNGAGKTTLFSALTWCLYKVNLNDTVNTKLPTLKHYRTPEFKGTRVQVVFGIGKYKYLVARHIAYKGTTKGLNGEDSLLIFRKEKVDKTKITAADIVNDQLYKDDAQKYLNMLLGIDSKTFLASVIFGQRMSRLMESKDADKRSLFERLFDVEFVDALKEKATARISEANTSLQQAEADLKQLLYSQQLLTEQLESATFLLVDFAAKKKMALSIIKKDHGIAKADIEQLDKQIELSEKMLAKSGKSNQSAVLAEAHQQAQDNYYDAKTNVANIQRDIAVCERAISTATKDVADLKSDYTNVGKVCPTCGGPIPENKYAAARANIKTQLEERSADLKLYTGRLSQLSATETEYLTAVNKCLNIYSKALDEHNAIKQSNNNNASAEVNLATLVERRKNKVALLKQMVTAYNTEKAKEPPVIPTTRLQKDLADLEVKIPEAEKLIRIKTKLISRLGWWAKAFMANGLKTYIFSASLNRLNECVSVYTAYLGLSVVFGIDLSKASKPFYARVSLDGVNEIDYDQLSGGQRSKVDLCISFGMFDTISSTASFNIIVFDEAAEGLDYEAQEVLDTLLRIKSESKAVYVVSHYNMMDLSSATVYEVTGGTKGHPSIIE